MCLLINISRQWVTNWLLHDLCVCRTHFCRVLLCFILLQAQCLDIIFQALILSKITYALPAFARFISVTLKSKINKFFHKAHRRGLVTTLFDIQGLIDKYDTHLFGSIAYTDHCLHYLLPEKLNRSMNLRHRGHEYTLSDLVIGNIVASINTST